MYDCPECGCACFCDLEDHDTGEAPNDCDHNCAVGEEDSFDDYMTAEQQDNWCEAFGGKRAVVKNREMTSAQHEEFTQQKLDIAKDII
jgi:hypothetical protein